MCKILPFILGYIIDLFVGDPVYQFHPVRLMGRFIYAGEKVLNNPEDCKFKQVIFGFLLSTVVILSAFLLPYILLLLLASIHPLLSFLTQTIFCWQIMAAGALKKESMAVSAALEKNNIEKARTALSMIVGRDTAQLNKAQIIRGAVETVAENTCDGVIAPMFYMAIGGAPLGFLYKAVNTLDSMIGYKNDRFFYFGKFSARLDDALNYIPARISPLLMLFSGGLLGFNVKKGWQVFRRDRKRHSSPNSAYTEAMCAGLLGVLLAGPSYYQGVLTDKPFIGDATREIAVADISASNKIMMVSAFLGMVLFTLVKGMFFLQ